MAKSSFEKLKKRYNRKKNDLKKAKRSGISTKEVEKAERALQEYQFLFWLDKFTYIRESRTNVEQGDSSDDEEDDEEMDLAESPQNIVNSRQSEDEEEVTEETQNTSSLNISRESSTFTNPPKKDDSVKKTQKNNKALNKSSKAKSKSAKSEYLEDMEINLIRDLGQSLASEKKVQKHVPDNIDTYVQSLASDLRTFSPREYAMIKHEFQGVIFKYQMSKFQMNPTAQPQWNQVSNGISNQYSTQTQWNNVQPGIQMNDTMTGQAQWSSPPPTPFNNNGVKKGQSQ